MFAAFRGGGAPVRPPSKYPPAFKGRRYTCNCAHRGIFYSFVEVYSHKHQCYSYYNVNKIMKNAGLGLKYDEGCGQ